MKVSANPRLFWFLKEGTYLDLSDPSTVEMYVQQVVTRGNTRDVQALLKTINPQDLRQTFKKINSFLPFEIKKFWEDFFGSH